MCEMQARSVITCFAAVLVAAAGAHADTPDRRAVKSEMKSLWDSLDTFAFRCDQVPPDDAMPSNSTRAHFRFDMAHGTGGRWALTWSSLKTGTPRVLECFREDGRRRYNIRYIHEDPNWMSRISIQAQISDSNSYTGMMFCVTWLLMPGGKPPFTYLDDDAVLEEESADGRRVVSLTTKYKGQPLRCVLDPDRDWLPQRVELGDSDDDPRANFEVTRFGRVNGRWFPVAGHELSVHGGKLQRWAFTISDLSINEPIDPGRFTMPVPTDGVVVRDETTRKELVKGGLSAQERLVQRYRAQKSAPPDALIAKPAAHIVASRDPARFPWSITLISSSGVVLVIVCILRLNRPHG